MTNERNTNGGNPFLSNLFPREELEQIRNCFYYVDRDRDGNHRLFFDNAGGSLRLRKAEEAFLDISSMPDASEHSNRLAVYLAEVEDRARKDIKETLFGASHGVLYPSYTASQIMMEMVRVMGEHARGTNYVTTVLEHPSSYDACAMYAEKNGCELRVAQANPVTGGVDADAILSLVDRDTAILSCMFASNISGYILDVEKVFREARQINPDIFLICDAVQHAPHGVLDPEKLGVDGMNFAPYKFFGVRGFALAYLSDRVASFPHHRLLGKAADDWEIGSPATAQFAAMEEVISYVASLGEMDMPAGSRREKFVAGMNRIAGHERALLYLLLEGTETVPGLRHLSGARVQMDGKDLSTRDLILSLEFENLTPEQAVAAYDKRGVVTFERSISSLYSKRMLEAFHSKGVVRLSPLHVNTVEEVEEFLRITQEVAAL